MSQALYAQVSEQLPQLRAYAIMLTRNREQADDLVQDTVVRVLSKLHQFSPETNFRAWIFTILRNQFIDDIRRRRRENKADMPNEALCDLQAVPGSQEDRMVLGELLSAIEKLPREQREILGLVVGQGMSYDQVAEIMKCPIGTVRSRLARARTHLRDLLVGDGPVVEEAEPEAPRPVVHWAPVESHAAA